MRWLLFIAFLGFTLNCSLLFDSSDTMEQEHLDASLPNTDAGLTAQGWQQGVSETASEQQCARRFGVQIALSRDGKTMAVGATNNLPLGEGQDQYRHGRVYLYHRNLSSQQWEKGETLTRAGSPTTNDQFGSALALSSNGDTLVVGAYKNDDISIDNISNAGHVYFYTRALPSKQWSNPIDLRASDKASNRFFGISIALSGSGDFLAVGDARSAGKVYLYNFDRNQNLLEQTSILKASNRDNSDLFGTSLALSADATTLVVSAVQESSDKVGITNSPSDNNDRDNSGAVYIYAKNNNGMWLRQAYIKASNTGSHDAFGTAVSLNKRGNRLAVGAIGEDGGATGTGGDQGNGAIDSGAVYIFDRSDNGSWAQDTYLKASNTGSKDGFGTSLSFDAKGNTLVVGAPKEKSSSTVIDQGQNDNTTKSYGAAYVFKKSADGWTQSAYLKTFNAMKGDQFGRTVVIGNEGRLVLGSSHYAGSPICESPTGPGALYWFEYK